jgi:hypothetical protein
VITGGTPFVPASAFPRIVDHVFGTAIEVAPWMLWPIRLSQPSTRRLRFPFGRRGPSPLGWTATSSQCRRELTEESLAAKADREKRPANGVALLTMVLIMQAQKTRGNKRQGWTPDGQSLEAGA